MSFRTGVLQAVLECGTSGDAKARFLFLEQPSVLSCQEVSVTLSILFGRHSSSCKVAEERPSLCWRSVINHFQTCKARYSCSAISYGVMNCGVADVTDVLRLIHDVISLTPRTLSFIVITVTPELS